MSTDVLRVLVACPGLDHVSRGYETFAAEAYRALKGREGLHVTLLKGSGPRSNGERRGWCLRRDGRVARSVQSILHRPYADYEIEEITFTPALYRAARRADVVLLSDQLAARALDALRRRLGGNFAVVLSNGAPYPGPFPYADLVHQVSPAALELSIERGERPERMRLLPHAFETAGYSTPTGAAHLRSRLGLPAGRPLLISVAALNNWHKRHRYLVSEVAALGNDRPHLALIGNVEPETEDLRAFAHEQLGAGVTIATVPAGEVSTWLATSDLFVLASVTEAFGRAIGEALLAGLPCILHDTSVMRFAAQDHARYIDMEKPGALAAAIRATLAIPLSPAVRAKRSRQTAARLSWDALAGDYEDMLRDAARMRSSARGSVELHNSGARATTSTT